VTTLLTGHGLVGARVVAQLRARDEEVVVYDLAPPEPGPGVVPIAGDLLDQAALLLAVRRHRPERILHTAGLLTPAGVAQPHDTIRVNVLGTANVLEVARLEQVPRVVLTSSVVVYDPTVMTDRVTEDHPCAPTTVYAATKRSAELLGGSYARSFGLSFLTVRFAAVYGPARRPGGGVSRLIHETLGMAIADGRASLKRRWHGRQELLYAEDAASALIAAGFAVAPRHDTFNVGSGQPVTVVELGRAIGAAAGGAEITVVDPGADANSDVVDAPLDITRARDELGWRPRFDLRRGLAEHAAWLRAQRP
jgi:nucleoside-diphosphate-sugar epimerase